MQVSARNEFGKGQPDFSGPVCYANKNDGGIKSQIGRKESMKCKIRNGEAGNAMQKPEL